jgi:hypothetical protein
MNVRVLDSPVHARAEFVWHSLNTFQPLWMAIESGPVHITVSYYYFFFAKMSFMNVIFGVLWSSLSSMRFFLWVGEGVCGKYSNPRHLASRSAALQYMSANTALPLSQCALLWANYAVKLAMAGHAAVRWAIMQSIGPLLISRELMLTSDEL